MPEPGFTGAAPENYTVRIIGPEGRPGGLGALVADRHVVTCAHVVNAALGRNTHAQSQPTGQVRVEFPLLDNPGGRPAEAGVVMWRPPQGGGVAGDDVAGLELSAESVLPARARPGRLAVEPPRLESVAYVFGYPTARPDGTRVSVRVMGAVGNGRLQLDSTPDSAQRVQQGFSGSPVFDDATGRIIGLVATAAETVARDSNAIGVERLRVAWPEVLCGRWQPAAETAGRRKTGELTILHVSDLRFDYRRLPGSSRAERADHPLFGRLHADIAELAAIDGLWPDVLVVTGNLTQQGRPDEFRGAAACVAALAEEAEIPRRHVAIVPGDHDVNRSACAAYFFDQQSIGEEPAWPYWRKWRDFAAAFGDFYRGLDSVEFTADEPWTLFEMADLAVVVAGLNSTMADSHLDSDHYGETGPKQLKWFAGRLKEPKGQGWLRLAAVHHDVAGGALPRASLRDAGDVDRVLGQPRLVNLLLHGHAASAGVYRLPSGLVALSTGCAGPGADGSSSGRYQMITVHPEGFIRAARQYEAGQRRWAGDTQVTATGSDWRQRVDYALTDVGLALPSPVPTADSLAEPGEPVEAVGDPLPDAEDDATLVDSTGGPDTESPAAFRGSEFFGRVKDAAWAKEPGAQITERPEQRYLRVTVRRDGGRIDQWAIGVTDGPATNQAVDGFIERVHRQFADIPGTRSELVYRSPPAASIELVQSALARGVLLHSLVEYQGLLDLTALAQAQRERLANDRIYPARLYVDQRYRIVSGGGHTDEIRVGLIDQAIRWLGAEGARLVVVLGDFGRGKTSFLRQLTRVLPQRLPAVAPILVELRSLEKAPSIDELLAQHLARQGVDEINLSKLRYMINSGRIALLLDGFDELELRVGYENAADYLQTLITAVTEQAKVIVTSRTQHFMSTKQVRAALAGQLRTELGDRVESRPESRMVVLEEFSDEQIVQFLANLYDGDEARARARFDLIARIGNLLDLVHNPRMLSFVADLDEGRLRDAQDETGQVSSARLYETIIDQWLDHETERQQHQAGLPSISKEERFAACIALALRLWAAKDPTIPLRDLSKEVAATLTGLAERGYTEPQLAHSIASGTLLISTDDEAFTFIHRSVMEWLVAKAATQPGPGRGRSILASRRMSSLMVAFFADLTGHADARGWAAAALADHNASEAAKQNAIAIMDHISGSHATGATATGPATQSLAGVDLRSQDLTGTDLRDADLRGANLRGMRLDDLDLSGADLTGADLTGAVLTGGSIRGAILTDSRWDRAAILGTAGLDDPSTATATELTTAAVAGRDQVEVMIASPGASTARVAFSPDGGLLAYTDGATVKIADASRGKVIRILRHGRLWPVAAVAFSPDGTLLASAAFRTARTWDTATGTPRTVLSGHTDLVKSIAFSPDGTLIATASADGTARTWDTATGSPRSTFTTRTDASALLTALAQETDVETRLDPFTGFGGRRELNAVAFSPDGTLIATASSDLTARTWDTASGTQRTVLAGHTGPVKAVAFSPDGTLIATASGNSARIWDSGTGTPRTTLTGHSGAVNAVAFSPDGTLIATASSDGTIRTWDTATGTGRTTLTGRTDIGTLTSRTDISPFLARLTEEADAEMHFSAVTEAQIGTDFSVTPRAGRPVWSVAFSPDGSLIATGSSDGTPRTWDTATGTPRISLGGHSTAVTAVAFSPDGTLIATASDPTASIWDAGLGAVRRSLPGQQGAVRAVAFSPDGALLATASERGARVWDIAKGAAGIFLQGHRSTVNGIAFSPDGSLIATASGGTARIFTSAGDLSTSLAEHKKTVTAVAFSPDGTRLATASNDRTARVWDLEPQVGPRWLGRRSKKVRILEGHTDEVNSVAFSPRGNLLVTGSDDRTARIWNLDGKSRASLIGHAASVLDAAFSSDGELVATASADTTARIWSIDGAPRSTLAGHEGSVRSVAFSPQGGFVATASSDGTTRLWDVRRGVCLATLIATAADGYATVLPDGRYQMDGDLSNEVWWAIKLCRFGPGELDPYVPEVRKLGTGERVLPQAEK